MKPPRDRNDGRQSNTEHPRPMSCRGSTMQRAIAASVRAAAPEIPSVRQSWRVKGVINGTESACPVLEACIDERIAAGASAESILAIPQTLLEQTRQKLMDARPEYAAMVNDLDAAMLYEQQVQGPADVAQMTTLRQRCSASIRDLINRMRPHREATEIVLVAAERALAERERANAMERSRFGLTSTGRAS
jgi:hypothetical protein